MNYGKYTHKGSFSLELVRKLNNIIKWSAGEDVTYSGVVVCSTLAFVEIARKFDEISAKRFTMDQFASFIDQPPEWFIIAALDRNLFRDLSSLPGKVVLPNGKETPIEWADAIHMATALSRDEPWLLAVTDSKIQATVVFEGKII
jgi:hypothetical protein